VAVECCFAYRSVYRGGAGMVRQTRRGLCALLLAVLVGQSVAVVGGDREVCLMPRMLW
jgi:hypothetical protein